MWYKYSLLTFKSTWSSTNLSSATTDPGRVGLARMGMVLASVGGWPTPGGTMDTVPASWGVVALGGEASPSLSTGACFPFSAAEEATELAGLEAMPLDAGVVVYVGGMESDGLL